jgi:two-component system invasion response regulator UvrY
MLKILIADDHPIVRQGLKQALAESRDMVVAGEAGDGQEVLSEVSQRDFDIVVLDITMPGRNGLDILKDIKHMNPELPVLILSFHPEEQYALRALRSGASGYLTKQSAVSELESAIRKIAAGGKYVTLSLGESIAFYLDAKEEVPHETLSDREYEVMCMIASGKSVTTIANELSLSVKTVSTHRSRILQKTHLRDNTGIIRYCLQHSLVD